MPRLGRRSVETFQPVDEPIPQDRSQSLGVNRLDRGGVEVSELLAEAPAFQLAGFDCLYDWAEGLPLGRVRS